MGQGMEKAGRREAEKVNRFMRLREKGQRGPQTSQKVRTLKQESEKKKEKEARYSEPLLGPISYTELS